MAQPVKHLTAAQVMISGFVGLSPASGSMLIVCLLGILSLSLPLPNSRFLPLSLSPSLSLSLSVSLKIKKKNFF